MSAPAPAVLDAHLRVDRGRFRLDLALRLRAGEVVALLGPNGAGKTTALRALAGLTPLSAGHVTLAGVDVDRPRRRQWTPPHRRPVGLVFQEHLLFPHLSAVDNVAFGLRRRGVGRGAARARARQWLAGEGLAAVADRRPPQLSGGQAQRVALARTLILAPALVLLDEPFAALDAAARFTARARLRDLVPAPGGAALLVTHDPLEARALADRLVVVEGGRVAQEGSADAVFARPHTRYVAELAGLNLCRGTGGPDGVRVGEVTVRAAGAPPGPACAAFPPARVALHRSRPDPRAGSTWPATIDGVQRHGDQLRVRLGGPLDVAADLDPAAAARLDPVPGRAVWAAVQPAAVRAYPDPHASSST